MAHAPRSTRTAHRGPGGRGIGTRHALAISPTQAVGLTLVAHAEHTQTLPETTTPAQGALSLAESAAIIKGGEAAVEKKDATHSQNADANRFRAKTGCGLQEITRQRPRAPAPPSSRSAAPPAPQR